MEGSASDDERGGNGGDAVGNGASSITGAAARIKALDAISASNIRNTQVITGVSDVVRELVENAIDAGATSIQVSLLKNGADKIEVRDNGHGILAKDVQAIFLGGHTSKLKNMEHLSRGKYLGFRGEALHALCAAGNVSLTTQTSSDVHARKYQLDAMGVISKETKGSHGGGTTIVVEKLFENIRVRRQRLLNEKTALNEIKNVEAYLNGVALANPKCHLSFYNNSTFKFTKGSVQTTKDAIVAVLGNKIGKNMEKYGPIIINLKEEKEQHDEDENCKRSIELYLPKKPVDMPSMSFTSNKLALIFCNRKRVYIREFEKLIHRYITACVVKPQPADRRRFPVSILCISVPSKEADFNRDVDKAKVFLVHKDKIYEHLEEALITFYGVNLKNSDGAESKPESTCANEMLIGESFQISLLETDAQSSRFSEKEKSRSVRIPVIPSSRLDRDNIIGEFLMDIPSSTRAFSESPCKANSNNLQPITVEFPASKPVVEMETLNDIQTNKEAEDGLMKTNPLIPRQNVSKSPDVVSNFTIALSTQTLNEIDLMDTSQPESIHLRPPIANMLDDGILAKRIDMVSENKFKNWLEGKLMDQNGQQLQNVNVVSATNKSPLANVQDLDQRFTSALLSGSGSTGPGCTILRPRTPSVGAYAYTPSPKRPKLMEERSSEMWTQSSSPSVRLSSSFAAPGTPSPMCKQTTLDSLPNWNLPTSNIEKSVGGSHNISHNGFARHVDINQIKPPPPVSDQSNVNAAVDKVYKLLRKQQAESIKPQYNKSSKDKNLNSSSTWPPCLDFAEEYEWRQPQSRILGRVSCPANLSPLFLVAVDEGLGVFSVRNLIHQLCEYGLQVSGSAVTQERLQQMKDANSISDSDAHFLFSEFLKRNTNGTLPRSGQVIHIIKRSDTLLTEFLNNSLLSLSLSRVSSDSSDTDNYDDSQNN